MAGINVGSVLVDVIPDARGWDEKLSAQVAPAAERVGKSIGRQIEDDIADGVRRGVDKARLEMATLGDAKIHVSVDTDTAAADAKVAAEKIGTQFGNDFNSSAANNARTGSPLIMAAVAGGFLAGGPLLVAAAGVVAGGVAAVFLHNQTDVANAASEMAKEVKTAYSGVADAAIPDLTLALGKLRNAAVGMAPQMRDLFANVGPAIQGVTDGIIGLAQNAMPGLIAAVRTGAPVFEGLRSFLASIGTGLGDMFQILSQHAPAFGQVFKSVGDIIGSLLPILGDLMAAGGELGALILPPLAAALGVVRDVLHAIAPILPEIAIGFGAFKVVGLLSGPIESFGKSLGSLATRDIGLVSSAAGGMSTALGGVGAALPFVGLAVGALGAVMAAHKQDVDGWAQALLKGGAAAEAAKRELDGAPGIIDRVSAALQGHSTAFGVNKLRTDEATKAYKDLLDAMNPLQRAQALATQAQNDLNNALAHHDTHGAAVALSAFTAWTAEAAHQQALLNAALNNTSAAEEENKQRLQGLANTAGAANSQINLLKGALDALTGKAVSLGDAEVAVTNAVDAAKNALQGKTGALVTATGAVNTHTTAGAALWQSMTQIASADNTLIATLEKQGGTAAQVAAKDAELRGQFVATAQQMGLTAGQAQNLANQIYGIPEQRKTEITADTDAAHQRLLAIQAAVDAMHGKNIVIQVTAQGGTATSTTAARNALYGEMGGIVHPFASGGFEPMQGGIAQVVAPQTFRVIGDRVTDDEAYIPINNSLRSLQILSQTASRMNYALTPSGGGASGGGGSFTGNLYLDSGEFLGKVRGEATQVVAGALNKATDRGQYN